MAEVMKPCPFCGGVANLRDYDYPRKPVFIDCDPCNLVIEGDDGTVESAIAAWNLRAPDATLLLERDELREALRNTIADLRAEFGTVDDDINAICDRAALADKGVR